jgi:hypothetical protein
MCAGGRGTLSNPDDQGSDRLHTRRRSTRMREPHCFYGKSGNDLVSIYYVAVFFVGLAGFLSLVLTLAIDPFVAVLLALGSMELLLQSLGEQLEVSQLEIEH